MTWAHVQYEACVQGGLACVTPPTMGRFAELPEADEYHAAAPDIVFHVCHWSGRTVPPADGT